MAKPKQKFNLKNEDYENSNVHDLATKKRFSVHDLISIQAKNANQQKFFDAYNKDTPIIAQVGCAGTGKTFLAMYAALHEVLSKNSEYKQVVVFRSAVETRKVGFLPGALEGPGSKSEVYELPYKCTANEIFKEFKEPYVHLKALGYLDFQLTSFQRGMNYKNCIMIVDEFQNLDYAEILTICTRMGTNSKLILCGDTKQNDLSRTRETSGFEKLLRLFGNMNNNSVAIIEYGIDDIVRSGIVKEILEADFYLKD